MLKSERIVAPEKDSEQIKGIHSIDLIDWIQTINL
jgi:hypothetical protein